MYYPHFGLKEPPFKITPNTDFFFSGGNRGAVLDALVYAITNGEGIIKVVGEVGSGKTMLCRMLQTILPEKIESIYLANPSVAPEDVLHAIAFELQLKLAKNADRLKVMQVLQAHLLSRHAEGRQVVIFVEEAQGMPLATLEEIRLLSNLETKQDKLLQIVLFGQPELDVNLSETHIRQLRERITHSFHLEPLGTKDIGEYLILRLRAAGYHGPHLFSESAIKKLSSAAKGLARRVNILADKSLLAAFADNVYQVTPKHVKAAIQDSEFGRNATNYKQYFIWAILLIACLAAFVAYMWWQKAQQSNVAKATVSQAVKLDAKAMAKPAIQPALVVNNSTPAPVAVVNSAEAALNTANAAAIVTPPAIQVAPNNVVANPAVVPIVATATLPTPPVAPVITTPNAVVVTPALVNPAVESPIDAAQQLVVTRIAATKNLLASGASDTVTLQLMSSTDNEQLKQVLAKLSQQLEVDNIYLYQKNQKGVNLTIFLYGAYAQRSEALAALQNLPSQIKNNKPHLRTIAGINKEIEQAQ
ncbi:MAG: AAA family ATPase [Methylotenera sp.]|nr:AAA family ATPase [Methylotenera sp.]